MDTFPGRSPGPRERVRTSGKQEHLVKISRILTLKKFPHALKRLFTTNSAKSSLEGRFPLNFHADIFPKFIPRY
jgi:hypothetical protein